MVVEIITLIMVIIGTGAAVVQAWVAYKTYKKTHPTQGNSQVSKPGIAVSSPPKRQISIPWGQLGVTLFCCMSLGFFPHVYAAIWGWHLGWAISLAFGMALLVAFLSAFLKSEYSFAFTMGTWFILVIVYAFLKQDTFLYRLLHCLAGSLFILSMFPVISKDLLNSFSRFHTFLILVVISALGLSLGWLVYEILISIFPPISR